MGTRVQKLLEWNGLALRTGTVQGPIYQVPGRAGYYVDVLWDHNQKVEPCHLYRIVRMPEAADA